MSKSEVKFYCSRVERGASSCGTQCDQCVKRDATPPTPINGKEVEDNVVDLKPRAEMPAGPEIVGQITITLTSDGNFKLDGPFDDRILFHGLMSLAMDAERDVAVNRRMRKMLPKQTETYWQKKMKAMKEKFGLAGKKITDEALKQPT
jgi:hypothetical protein